MIKTQKLSIRLLCENITPTEAIRDGVHLESWEKIDQAQIATGTLGGNTPKWASFLEIDGDENIYNKSAYSLIFITTQDRWFAISFGLGHAKIDPSAIEQDFGLKVVLNSVDPKQLKSTDIRTPDENTLSRRTQTSRNSDQTAFEIDIERDLIRGLAGTPKDENFGSYVAGADALTLNRKLEAAQLIQACEDAYAMYKKDDYKDAFGWVDQIRHVRDKSLIEELEAILVDEITVAINMEGSDNIQLAFPEIYDPEKTTFIRYKGFQGREIYQNLDFTGYSNSLKNRGKFVYKSEDLKNHTVNEVDDHGKDCGRKWPIGDCIAFETVHKDINYVLSGGRWYEIEESLSKEVNDFFDKVEKFALPKAEANENEETYNKRVAQLDVELICLDRRLIIPTGAKSRIEACDFLGLNRHLIHIKDKTSSSRLSHLFNQGIVSAHTLAIDPPSRDKMRSKITEAQNDYKKVGFDNIIPDSMSNFIRGDFTITYGVIVDSATPELPFFSLLTFRQAARDLYALGYKVGFSWISKPKPVAPPKKGKVKKAKKAKKAAIVK